MVLELPTEDPANEALFLPDSHLSVRYKRVADRDARYTIELDSPSDQVELSTKLAEQIAKEFWFVDPEIRAEELRQRFSIRLDEDIEVELFNFQERFGEKELAQVASTLALYYHALKDKSLWTLKTVQIREKAVINNKSGVPYRGFEFPHQSRFELYPASFEDGNYRGNMNCTWAEGSTAHEATHVVLERALEQLWSQNREELGWELLEDQLIILPGGATTALYNKNYRELPSDYAAYQRDDDRAESVVAFLFDPDKLNGIRKKIVSTIFDQPNDSSYELSPNEPVLPELPLITVRVLERDLENEFEVMSRFGPIRYANNPKPPLELAQYRKIRDANHK